jgi:hypothetical protein
MPNTPEEKKSGKGSKPTWIIVAVIVAALAIPWVSVELSYIYLVLTGHPAEAALLLQCIPSD